jgi:hypothetical protein
MTTNQEIEQIRELLKEIGGIYDGITHSDHLLTHAEEGQSSNDANSETLVMVFEPSSRETLVENYQREFYGWTDASSRLSTAYRRSRKNIASALRRLRFELNDIYGATENSMTPNQADAKSVISRLEVFKAQTAFIWMLISYFKSLLDDEAQRWVLEGPEYVLDRDLANRPDAFWWKPR